MSNPPLNIIKVKDECGNLVVGLQIYIQSSKNDNLIELVSNQQGEYFLDFNKNDFPITIKIKDPTNKFLNYEKIVSNIDDFTNLHGLN